MAQIGIVVTAVFAPSVSNENNWKKSVLKSSASASPMPNVRIFPIWLGFVLILGRHVRIESETRKFAHS